MGSQMGLAMKRITLDFCDFWPGFSKTENYFYRLLTTTYDVVLSDSPDYVIYSCFGRRFRRYKCVRIFYSGENRRVDFGQCDYAFTHDYADSPRHYRLPLYGLYHRPDELVKPEDFDVEAVLREKTRFCSFVFSNAYAPVRNAFFHKLSRYKKVDSGGRYLNNVGGPVGDKLAFVREHKFDISFENASYPGYTTEKLTQPMQVHTVPIYWGNSLVHRDFNPRSFINYHDFGNEDELIEHIIRVDNDEGLYRQYLVQPYYHNNEVNEFISPENVLEQFDRIFTDDVVRVAVRKRKRFVIF